MPQVTNFLKKKKNERTSLKKGCDLPQITQFKKWGNDQVRKQITGFIIQCKYKYQQNIQQSLNKTKSLINKTNLAALQPHPKRKKKNNMNHKNQGTRVNDTNNLIRLEKHWRHY